MNRAAQAHQEQFRGQFRLGHVEFAGAGTVLKIGADNADDPARAVREPKLGEFGHVRALGHQQPVKGEGPWRRHEGDETGAKARQRFCGGHAAGSLQRHLHLGDDVLDDGLEQAELRPEVRVDRRLGSIRTPCDSIQARSLVAALQEHGFSSSLDRLDPAFAAGALLGGLFRCRHKLNRTVQLIRRQGCGWAIGRALGVGLRSLLQFTLR